MLFIFCCLICISDWFVLFLSIFYAELAIFSFFEFLQMESDETEYEISGVVDEVIWRGQIYFLVRWKDSPETESEFCVLYCGLRCCFAVSRSVFAFSRECVVFLCIFCYYFLDSWARLREICTECLSLLFCVFSDEYKKAEEFLPNGQVLVTEFRQRLARGEIT